MEGQFLHSNVMIEYYDRNGSMRTREKFLNCCAKLLKTNFDEIILEVRGTKGNKGAKSVRTQQLRHVVVHSNFVHEGKASLELKEDKITIFFYNAPPVPLDGFLKFIILKIKENENENENSNHSRSNFLERNAYPQEDVHRTEQLRCTNDATSREISAVKRPCEETVRTAKRNCLMAHQGLTDEQREVFEAVKNGLNIFFTGAAGTGKSHLLKVILTALPPETTYLTASTGLAASQLGGMTLHQFAGLGRGDGSLEKCLDLASRPHVSKVWRKCQHLIIDEVSMVHGDFFERLEEVARVVRKNKKPFGGIQLIMCGDFFQLPPVGRGATFCFETFAWDKCVSRCFELTQCHRHTDPELKNILDHIRVGSVPKFVHDQLVATSAHDFEKDGVEATTLCACTEDVSRINNAKLKQLPGEEKSYISEDDPHSLASLMDNHCSVPNILHLKLGAQVMLVKTINSSRGLINGARGVVVGFDSDDLPRVKFSSHTCTLKKEKFTVKLPYKVPASRMQIPVNLAWALSIHRSQGLTLDRVQVSLSRIFEPGHAYVALSRVKSLDCLQVLDFDPKKIRASPKVLSYQEKLNELIEYTKLLKQRA